MIDYSLEATYFRTALLLGLIDGDIVHRWAEQSIECDPGAPQALIEVITVPPTDLSALRHALWPLVVEPEPATIIEAMLQLLHTDLASGRRTLADTLTVLRQMRSMLRLPPRIYADLNSALVAYAAATTARGEIIAEWLGQFAQCGFARLQPPKQ